MGAASKRSRRTLMSKQIPRTTVRPFDYRRDRDGVDDVYEIIDHRGVTLASIP
jgi:hypothetical protein